MLFILSGCGRRDINSTKNSSPEIKVTQKEGGASSVKDSTTKVNQTQEAAKETTKETDAQMQHIEDTMNKLEDTLNDIDNSKDINEVESLINTLQ